MGLITERSIISSYSFKNVMAMNKVKNMFYEYVEDTTSNWGKRRVLKKYEYKDAEMELFEANIPPLLRYFHIRNISPSGWVSIKKSSLRRNRVKRTNCKFEYEVSSKNIKALTEREDSVPYKICSFDIEASSSHGDFPIPVKDYKKLVTNILDYWDTNRDEFEEYDEETKIGIIRTMINAAFGFEDHDYIDIVYPKTPAKKKMVNAGITKMLTFDMITAALGKQDNNVDRETMDHFIQDTDDIGSGNADGDGEIKVVEETTSSRKKKRVSKYQGNIIALLDDKKIDREDKLNLIIKMFNIRERSTNKRYFPELKGDKVTFIGSTFMKWRERTLFESLHCS